MFVAEGVSSQTDAERGAKVALDAVALPMWIRLGLARMGWMMTRWHRATINAGLRLLACKRGSVIDWGPKAGDGDELHPCTGSGNHEFASDSV